MLQKDTLFRDLVDGVGIWEVFSRVTLSLPITIHTCMGGAKPCSPVAELPNRTHFEFVVCPYIPATYIHMWYWDKRHLFCS